jgi:hypothetical protein
MRLTFGGKLLQAAATQREAYRVLAWYLPFVKLRPTPNDFLLQINRRKKSSRVVKGLPINRLSTWSKMNVVVFAQPGTSFTWPENCYSALELNMNTAPEKAEVIPNELLVPLFRELADLGIALAKHGYRKPGGRT